MKSLDELSRSIKDSNATLLRRDIATYGTALPKEASVFVRDVTLRAKREKATIVTLIAILRD